MYIGGLPHNLLNGLNVSFCESIALLVVWAAGPMGKIPIFSEVYKVLGNILATVVTYQFIGNTVFCK